MLVVGTVAGVEDHLPLTAARTVVVVGADTALGRAEVRSAEEAYRTWSRAGAPGVDPGVAWAGLQTRHGGHHAVQALVRWDLSVLLRHDCTRRVELGFPPARRLVLDRGPSGRASAGHGHALALPASGPLGSSCSARRRWAEAGASSPGRGRRVGGQSVSRPLLVEGIPEPAARYHVGWTSSLEVWAVPASEWSRRRAVPWRYLEIRLVFGDRS